MNAVCSCTNCPSASERYVIRALATISPSGSSDAGPRTPSLSEGRPRSLYLVSSGAGTHRPAGDARRSGACGFVPRHDRVDRALGVVGDRRDLVRREQVPGVLHGLFDERMAGRRILLPGATLKHLRAPDLGARVLPRALARQEVTADTDFDDVVDESRALVNRTLANVAAQRSQLVVVEDGLGQALGLHAVERARGDQRIRSCQRRAQ